ncbi:MAG: CxxxxCH/CxxCH domain-containing protein, partial [Desulfobulbaceae bacterium]|nr:CxxxxCH/CxxCH domain-containing protein [Desulfobulbaceae bacterium]
MKKSIICLLLVLLARTATAAVLDAPHNDTNNISCSRCHSYSVWWQYSPVQSDSTPGHGRTEQVNTICLSCHGDTGPEISAAPHSSSGMTSLHRDTLDPWSRICTDCHDPHFQAQIDWQTQIPATVTGTGPYLITGDLASTPEVTPAPPYFSTFQFTNLSVKYNSITDNWQNATRPWAAKSGTTGRGLILVLPDGPGRRTYEITEVNESAGQITVNGNIPNTFTSGVHFGLVYGQLIRNSIVGAAGLHNVKFFDPNGGFVDTSTSNNGLCQVCHTLTNHFQYNATDAATDHQNKIDDTGASGANTRCTHCHKHGRGFAAGSDSGKHPEHLAMGVSCEVCHIPGGGIMDPLTATGCNSCHNDGKGGPPNDGGAYRTHWLDLDPNYALTCNSCHKGRLLLADAVNTAKYSHTAADSKCDRCHDGRQTLAAATNTTYAHQPADTNCESCHDGPGANPLTDFREAAVGMQSNGHTRLASSQWIRQYACYYCHTDSVDTAGNWKAAHLNHSIDVKIDSQWAIVGMPQPQYLPSSKTCQNVYCHSDGTTLNPEMRDYAWTGGHQECNSCHGHQPSAGGCNASGCLSDGRDGSYWNKFPEKKWLSAMPMYQ